MIATIWCICGYGAMTEDDLNSHFIECHRLSYGLGSCGRETSGDHEGEGRGSELTTLVIAAPAA